VEASLAAVLPVAVAVWAVRLLAETSLLAAEVDPCAVVAEVLPRNHKVEDMAGFPFRSTFFLHLFMSSIDSMA
jgi:hypothetical protein